MTKTLHKYKAFLPAAALALLVVVGSPSLVMARNGDDNQGNPTKPSQVAVTEESTSDDSEMATTTVKTAESKEDRRNKAKAKVESLRTERKVVTTPEVRKKVCDNLKNGLTIKFASISSNAAAYQGRIDAIYAGIDKYEASPAPSDLESLKSAAVAAQTKSAESIAALKEITPSSVDCNKANVAVDVAEFKSAASQVRSDLKDYKMAVKEVVKSLKSATKLAIPTTEGQTNEEN